MPEEYEGQHYGLSTSLCDSKHTTINHLTVELFLLSNNLASHGPSGKSDKSMARDDRRILNIFQESGWKCVKHLEIMLSIPEPTAGAIAEKVFVSALRLLDMDNVEMMLKAGVNPNNPFEADNHGVHTPLQFAAFDGSTKLIALLLSHGASVGFSFDDDPALYHAVCARNEEAIRALLLHGAIFTSPYLCAARVEGIDTGLVGDLIDACSDVNAPNRRQDPSALAQAVKTENDEAMELLLAKRAEVNALTDFKTVGWRFGNTTVLGLGVILGNSDIV